MKFCSLKDNEEMALKVIKTVKNNVCSPNCIRFTLSSYANYVFGDQDLSDLFIRNHMHIVV